MVRNLSIWSVFSANDQSEPVQAGDERGAPPGFVGQASKRGNSCQLLLGSGGAKKTQRLILHQAWRAGKKSPSTGTQRGNLAKGMQVNKYLRTPDAAWRGGFTIDMQHNPFATLIVVSGRAALRAGYNVCMDNAPETATSRSSGLAASRGPARAGCSIALL